MKLNFHLKIIYMIKRSHKSMSLSRYKFQTNIWINFVVVSFIYHMTHSIRKETPVYIDNIYTKHTYQILSSLITPTRMKHIFEKSKTSNAKTLNAYHFIRSQRFCVCMRTYIRIANFV